MSLDSLIPWAIFAVPAALSWAASRPSKEQLVLDQLGRDVGMDRALTSKDVLATINGLRKGGMDAQAQAHKMEGLLNKGRNKEYTLASIADAGRYIVELRKAEAAEAKRVAEIAAHQKRAEELHAAKQLWAKTGDTRVQGVPEYRFNSGGEQWVYVFTYPSQLTIAKHTGTVASMKIGMTQEQHYRARIREQTRGSGMPEQPIIVMAVRCADAPALERHLHIELDAHHDKEAGGTEWFRATPAQILNAMGSRVSAV